MADQANERRRLSVPRGGNVTAFVALMWPPLSFFSIAGHLGIQASPTSPAIKHNGSFF
jgi:hypothetical protein